MVYINSRKNGIIIQPITLQIRVPFQFLTNQREIQCTHYSEPRDGLNGCCSFSVVCSAREQLLDWFIQLKRCTVEQISPLFNLYLYLFLKFPRERVPCSLVGFFLHSTVCTVGPLMTWLRRRNRSLRVSRCLLP